MSTLYWLNDDLRLQDNPALNAATACLQHWFKERSLPTTELSRGSECLIKS